MDEKKKNLCAMIPESLHIKVREEQEQLALQIPEELFVRIKEHLSKYGLTQKEFIIGLIEAALTDATDAEAAE